jgi:hypothetical protein
MSWDIHAVFCVDTKRYDKMDTPVSYFSTHLFLRVTEYHNFQGNVTSALRLTMGPICCPETSIINYHCSLRDNPEQHSGRNISYLCL